MKKMYLLLFLLFSCFQCSDNKLIITNNSPEDIIVYYYKTEKITQEIGGVHIIKAYTNENINTTNRKQWEEVFEESEEKKIRFLYI